MKRSVAGWALMASGVACMIIYLLISLGRFSRAGVRFGGELFYVGIVLILIGAVLTLLVKVEQQK